MRRATTTDIGRVNTGRTASRRRRRRSRRGRRVVGFGRCGNGGSVGASVGTRRGDGTPEGIRRVGGMQSHKDGVGNGMLDAVAALGADGRFQVDYMAEQRRLLRESRAAAVAEPGAGSFDATVTPITACNHVASDIADADVAERLAKALANATTGFHSIAMVSAGFEVRKIAVGTALLCVMRARNQALASVPKMPAAGEDVAILSLLVYLYERPIVTPTGPPTSAAPAAGTTDAGPTMMMLSPEALEALRPAKTESVPPSTGSDKTVLGKAPTTDGTLKRPEYFAAGNVGDS